MKNIYHLSTCDTCRRILGELNPGPEVTLQDIKENPLNEAQLEALKERAGSYEALFSKWARLFRQRGLHEKSLTEADYRDLLLEQRVRVSEAASHVGYESAAQFSREFKRYFGNSPSECRNHVSGR